MTRPHPVGCRRNRRGKFRVHRHRRLRFRAGAWGRHHWVNPTYLPCVGTSGRTWHLYAIRRPACSRVASIRDASEAGVSLTGRFEPKSSNAYNAYKVAESHLGLGLATHELHDYLPDQVRLVEFRAWGESLPAPFTFPESFPKASALPEAVLSEPTKPAGMRWPWGEHETELLRHLAAAGERFWKRYDPADPTTAPTNQVVADWLKGRGVAERNAQVMATLLRADSLPTGPRK